MGQNRIHGKDSSMDWRHHRTNILRFFTNVTKALNSMDHHIYNKRHKENNHCNGLHLSLMLRFTQIKISKFRKCDDQKQNHCKGPH